MRDVERAEGVVEDNPEGEVMSAEEGGGREAGRGV